MGDMSDWIVENGLMEWYEEGCLEPLYEYQGLKTCSYCGQTGLHWVNLGAYPSRGRFRLAERSGKLHNCDEYRRKRQAEMRERLKNANRSN